MALLLYFLLNKKGTIMVYVSTDMIKNLKNDVKNGMIWGLRLVKTDNEAIRKNSYALIFGESNEIVGFDENCFYLKVRRVDPHYLPGTCDGKNYALPDFSIPSFEYYDAEAFYDAFSYYDGDILRSVIELPSAVNEKDKVKVTEYEVIRSY